jgi:glycosyltransferase involved in cell wall biosynthesis
MKTDNPLLSIVIPVYNGEAFVKNRLGRLLKLNLSGAQIVVVDDGSCDRSVEICRKCLSHYENYKLISQNNQGPGGARNTGIKESDGEYIIFLDSDDILLSAGLHSLKMHLYNKKPDILTGKILLINKNGKSISPGYAFPNVFSADSAREFIFSYVSDNIWHSVRYVFRREFLLKNRLSFNKNLICGEDMDFSLNALSLAEKIDFLDEVFYGYYYTRPGSITQTLNGRRISDVNKVVTQNINRFAGKKYNKAVVYRLIMESFYGLNRYCLCSSALRLKLRPGIDAAIGFYRLSPSLLVHVFLKTRGLIPLYIWSLALFLLKSARGLFKNTLGPVSLKRIPGGKYSRST